MEIQNISGAGVIPKGFSAETVSRPEVENIETRVERETANVDESRGQNFDSQA